MFNIEKFGLKIAQLRKRADMTQFELAERLNLTRQAISKYERGESFPDVTILVELAEALGVTAGELISAGEGTAGETRLLEQIATGQIPQSGAASQDILGIIPENRFFCIISTKFQCLIRQHALDHRRLDETPIHAQRLDQMPIHLPVQNLVQNTAHRIKVHEGEQML